MKLLIFVSVWGVQFISIWECPINVLLKVIQKKNRPDGDKIQANLIGVSNCLRQARHRAQLGRRSFAVQNVIKNKTECPLNAIF